MILTPMSYHYHYQSSKNYLSYSKPRALTTAHTSSQGALALAHCWGSSSNRQSGLPSQSKWSNWLRSGRSRWSPWGRCRSSTGSTTPLQHLCRTVCPPKSLIPSWLQSLGRESWQIFCYLPMSHLLSAWSITDTSKRSNPCTSSVQRSKPNFAAFLAQVYVHSHTDWQKALGTSLSTLRKGDRTFVQYARRKAGRSYPACNTQLPCCKARFLDQAWSGAWAAYDSTLRTERLTWWPSR